MNWNTPESTRNVKNASMNLSRSGVLFKYDFQSTETGLDTLAVVVCEACFGPAMVVATWNWPDEFGPKRKSVCVEKFSPASTPSSVMHTPGLRLASSSLLAASKKPCRTPWTPRRHVHMRKHLPYNIEDGLGNFMSSRTLQMVAVEYQQGLLDRLSQECRGKYPSRTVSPRPLT